MSTINESLLALKAGTATNKQYSLITSTGLRHLNSFTQPLDVKEDVVQTSITKFYYSDFNIELSSPITYYINILKNEMLMVIKSNNTQKRIPPNNLVRESNTLVNGELLSIFDLLSEDIQEEPEIDLNGVFVTPDALLDKIYILILENNLEFLYETVYNNLSYDELCVKFDVKLHTVKNRIFSQKQTLMKLLTNTNKFVDYNKKQKAKGKSKQVYDPEKAKYYRELYKQKNNTDV